MWILRTGNALGTQVPSPSTRVFGSTSKYRMQWFSLRTCTVRATRASVECRGDELLGGFRGHAPPEFCKIWLSKMQFLAFPGPELGIRNYDKLIKGKKLFSNLKNNYFVCELPDVTCQTTGRCVRRAGLKQNPCKYSNRSKNYRPFRPHKGPQSQDSTTSYIIIIIIIIITIIIIIFINS